MRRVCLTLPTHRPCGAALAAIAEEAAYGAREFGAEVHLLVLDSSDAAARAEHRRVVAGLPAAPGVVVHHLDEAAQRAFLRRAAAESGAAEPERLTALMLPDGVSYGACTNRAFLLAEALGCASVHRRDSDSGYQRADGEPVFPIHQELAFLGRPAAEAAALASASRLGPEAAGRPVALAGGSFTGEMSVDLDEVRRLDPAVYAEVVALSVPDQHPPLWRGKLVAEAFRGAEPFAGDHTTLTRVSPTRVDMCNVALTREVYGRAPLPPARDTVGSDYFLLHLVFGARLPGVLHNRHIVNHHTGERRTGTGFLAYQVRLAKFFLAVPYLHAVYAAMAAEGEALLDEGGRVRTAAVAGLVREAGRADRSGDVRRLEVLERAYRALGGRWSAAAELLAGRRAELLAEARADMADFAALLDAWPALVRASGDIGLVGGDIGPRGGNGERV
ncbi:DUF6271 family protein, partial [Streptomyces solincola]|uniref:DUF6271 family protein n=1 Tax=Streptomyces solincola TaxID=2100817 RepID=UPI001C6132F3